MVSLNAKLVSKSSFVMPQPADDPLMLGTGFTASEKLHLSDVPDNIPLIRKDTGIVGTSLYKGVSWCAKKKKLTSGTWVVPSHFPIFI